MTVVVVMMRGLGLHGSFARFSRSCEFGFDNDRRSGGSGDVLLLLLLLQFLLLLELVHAYVLAERGRMRVALVACLVAAEVGLVGGVHVHVLLAVGAVGEAAVAAVELASERLFTFVFVKIKKIILINKK
jgi:hypothetical protein